MAPKPQDEQEPQIKVIDRRRFIQEGDEVRENPEAAVEPVKAAEAVVPPEPAAPPTAPDAAAAAAAPPAGAPAAGTESAKTAGTAQGAAPTPSPESAADRARRQADQAAAGLPPADFVTLIEYMAQQISMYLGEPDPMGRAIQANFPLAGLFLDLLGVIQEKTKGNLSLEESQILDQILYTLRLHYVQKRP
jgi:hypothetical protein